MRKRLVLLETRETVIITGLHGACYSGNGSFCRPGLSARRDLHPPAQLAIHRREKQKKRGKRKSVPRHEQHHLIASNKDLSLINLVYILINFGAFINKIFVSGSSLAELKADFVIHNC